MTDQNQGMNVSDRISGSTAEEIVGSIRALIHDGSLKAGDTLPPYRALAERLGVNRNTAMTAYRLLVQVNIAESRGRAGTVIADPYHEFAEEGFARDSVLLDVGDGNPAPELLPDPSEVTLGRVTPTLYGEPTIDPDLAQWATRWIEEHQDRPFRLTVTAGAVDAIERLLSQALTRGDQVALEDPCFLTSISTMHQNGFQPVPVAMDSEGMVPESLREALEAGVRAVVCTPRAHNPTGVSLTPERAAQLRGVLADYPQVMVIEDDHFALLATNEYSTIISPERERWALVRSMSKALGPDMRIAFVASDATTAERLAARISGGITWVSHLLQRITHAMLSSSDAMQQIHEASAHYAARNAAFVAELRDAGFASPSHDGLNIWVDTGASAKAVLAALMTRGWIARDGAAFALAGDHEHCLRFTVHELSDSEMRRLVGDLAESSQEAALAAAKPGSLSRR
ncbi:aminotransferase class I/II-fold pyridoxal phosphate-dependent enzyme [Leucobacter chinensis]|uniref:aminotransferase class I/II-fold pyridoxal phosphate-dependent enzyme n=1 Tax=Leucobacter chinensis TaxID=2851010 RepID=UPI0020B695F7|nr:aminotransferase class I/II-fold pyridoxal phosphate-dependent enzyme [Leucobacter chinensis]